MRLERSEIRAKKHLGQHFLHDQNIAQKIALALPDFWHSKKVIEIGPGTGSLTQYLLPKIPQLLCFDVDKESVDYLKNHFPEHANKFLLFDFLKTDFEQEEAPLALIGNLPYSISSPIFFKVLESKEKVGSAVFMIQKEVADRIASKHGNKVYGILSVLLQAYYEVEYLFKVPPGAFTPPPKVDSAVIRLTQKTNTDLELYPTLKKLVKTGFNNRRKTLRNALKPLNLPQETTNSVLLSHFWDKRAEQLSVEQFMDFAKVLHPLNSTIDEPVSTE